MPEPETTGYRLEQLKERWERDPTSRVFVQLAEEHRRRGEIDQALEVLEAGLAHHPAYLSARVALARCQLDLELPQEALDHLGSVLEKDPTHLLAGKLVVEAHLALGEKRAAREALDRYRVLGAPEEEVEDLQRRLVDASPSRQPPEAVVSEESPGTPATAPELFHLPTGEAAPLRWLVSNGRERRELYGALERSPIRLDLEEDGSRYRRGLRAGDVLGSAPTDAAVPGAGVEPVPALDEAIPEQVASIVADLPAEDETGTPVEVETPAPPEEAPEEPAGSGVAAAPEDLVLSEPETLAGPLPVEPAGGEVELATPSTEESPAPPAVAAPSPRSTVTLGDLYLRQGHLEEAESIYRAVLAADPTHERARRGLETAALRRRGWLEASDLLPGDGPRPAGLTATKRELLELYLNRLKEGAARDVPRSTS
jgi:tetratricopeptide (TPR) repeat protein